MCDCGNKGNCQAQESELRRLRVKVKTLQRTTKDTELKKEYREQAIAIDTILEHIRESGWCITGEELRQIRNYIKGEQAKSNQRK